MLGDEVTHYCTARLMLSLMKSQTSECTLYFWKMLNVCVTPKDIMWTSVQVVHNLWCIILVFIPSF